MNRKKILGINGSASPNSSNFFLLKKIAELGPLNFDLNIIDDLSVLPHFRTDLTDMNVPQEIVTFRNQIQEADGIIICTPEYVFSIPSGLKNAIEWSVSTTVFSNKPVGLITASAHGEKGHEELKLIMKTIQASFTEETTLLIQGVKGKIARNGDITDQSTEQALLRFYNAFLELIK